MFLLEWVRSIRSRFSQWVQSLEQRSFAFAVFLASVKAFNENNSMHLAAGVAYYALLSLFPLMLGFIALSSFALESAEARDAVINGVTRVLPGTADLVRRNIELALRERGTIGIVAAVILLWSGKGVFAAIMTSLNLAWNVKESRPFLQRTAMQLGMVFAVGLFLLFSLAITGALQFLARLEAPLTATHPFAEIWNLLAFLLPLALTMIAFYLVYRFVPNAVVASQDAWPGAITAGVLFVIAQNTFVYFTTTFTSFPLVYGSIAAVIVLLLWAWISSLILLFGAEISAECSALRRCR